MHKKSVNCKIVYDVFTETAINIGYSCQLLTDEMEEVFVIDAEEKDEVLKQLEDALKHIDDVKKGHKDHVDAEVVFVLFFMV